MTIKSTKTNTQGKHQCLVSSITRRARRNLCRTTKRSDVYKGDMNLKEMLPERDGYGMCLLKHFSDVVVDVFAGGRVEGAEGGAGRSRLREVQLHRRHALLHWMLQRDRDVLPRQRAHLEHHHALQVHRFNQTHLNISPSAPHCSRCFHRKTIKIFLTSVIGLHARLY